VFSWPSKLCFGLVFLDWVGGEVSLTVGFAEYSSTIAPYYRRCLVYQYGSNPVLDPVLVGLIKTNVYLEPASSRHLNGLARGRWVASKALQNPANEQ